MQQSLNMKIIFATANANKLKEAQGILGNLFEIVPSASVGITEDIEESGTTIEENSLIKARYIWERSGETCFADDTGLEVEALDGRPGVYSARYGGEPHDPIKNMNKLLEELKGKTNRKARFRTVVTLILQGKEHQFEGILNGVIIDNPSGDKGFGYDPIFIPQGYDITLAQMDSAQKNAISHRGIAVSKLSKYLKEQ